MSAISTDSLKALTYELSELIYKSDRTLVYRSKKAENGEPVVIKLMRDEYPSFNELVKFRNQYAIMLRIADANAKNLEIEGIVKTHALERYENRYALIMEDTGGVSLAEYKGKASLSISKFLEIAIQLAGILHHLHQNNIIHKDIKPANILIQPETQTVKLIDFSISTLLPRETQTLQTPHILEGTLAYLSPEQTGRMNRGLDYRSDFYSLGVTFYELLTGNVPFTAEEPLELIHAHLAQNPDPPSKWVCLEGKFCPAPLSDIVLKLMAKNAEDRYQSALGIKHDLEKCLWQYQETENIEGFELGKRDICDRFLIPEKLYGREKEVQALLDAFERVASPQSPSAPLGKESLPTPLGKGGECPRAEMMLVAGFSGIGKTAVINEVYKPITRQKGYFLKGKFDQFNRNIPFSAFVQAFRSLMGQLLAESDTALAAWRSKILTALGESGQVLIEVIPELAWVIGKQPSIPELSGSAAQNRFNLLFEKFISVFTTKDHPLTIFLDDLQWADSASLNLIKILMGNEQRGYLLLLGAYRDNEVFPAHPLMLTLTKLAQQKAAISTITLAPLSIDRINQLVAETLSCQIKQSQPLTELIYQKTRGNPFFITQFLKGLYEDRLIVLNTNLGYWECDLVKIRDAALTDDVVEFMARRLYKLPETTQKVLKLAACIGNQFDLETLAIICETPPEKVAADLWTALQEGLILPQSEAYKFFQEWDKGKDRAEEIVVNYRFLHDRIQQAAYSLIVEQEKQIVHLKIGRQLLQNTSEENREQKIFAIVNQMNRGLELITQSSEQYQLAQLNFIAGKKAKKATAYTAAFTYAEIARSLFATRDWETHYKFILSITDLAAETAYLSGDFSMAEMLLKIIFDRAIDILDKVKSYEIKIQILMSQNKLTKAVEIGLQLLSFLDINLPLNPQNADIEKTLADLALKFSRDRIDLLFSLPTSNNPKQLASMRILSVILNAAYVGFPNLLPMIIAKQVDLSIDHGNTDVSPSAYANYGLILCNIANDFDLGYRMGNLALDLLKKTNSREFSAKTIEIVCFSVKHWKEHINSTLELLLEAYKLGLECGDFESASFAACDYCVHSFVTGKELVDVDREMFNYGTIFKDLQQEMVLNFNQLHRQTVLNLIEEKEHPYVLQGQGYDEDKKMLVYQQDNDTSSLALLYIDKLFLAYLFGYYHQAIELSRQAELHLEGIRGQVFIPIFYLYDALLWLYLYPYLEEKEQEKAIARISSHQAKIENWADRAPMNYTHKLKLIQAEKHRIVGKKEVAMEMYDRAIAGAKENEYIQEEALANELAAKFYLKWGREKIARTYLTDAYYCYAQWGAKAKVKNLEQHYPQLLQPILQRDFRHRTLRERTASKFRATITKITNNSHSQTKTFTNISHLLDFSSLLKASQTLSGEIELDRLLSKLMKTILENAGATKGALLLTSETGLTIEAIATRTDAERKLQLNSLHQSIPLEDYPDLPAGLIHTVRRTKETALLDAKTAQVKFSADNYLLRFSPQSLLCLPLLERGNLIGVLYLENTLAADAFTRDRIDLLDALCAQAAISLNNARLYQQAQQALTDLQQTQLQLVQNEKMATLGNLVAGVAHEINNPVGFIGGNVDVAQEHLQDLLEILSLYQENTSPSQEILEAIEDLNPEFIAEDFPKLIASMQTGCDRIRNISTSLRTFSRADADKKTEFNLHEGLDSTLLILKYRLKANERRPPIEIVKNYGEIPEVKCYPGQINQVFMNLLANAIDALDESNQGQTFEEIEKAPNRITMSTKLSEDKKNVIVRLIDNGIGMSETVKTRIFEQGFTTKKVGKGTGLGMAIAKSIIEEKHGGAIACQSELSKGTEFIIYLPIS